MGILDENQERQLEKVCDFAAIWHTPYFLQTTILARAPRLDFTFLADMKKLKEYDEGLSCVVAESLYLHSYYLSEELIPVALIDDGLVSDEKEAIAAKIYFSDCVVQAPCKPKLRSEKNDGLKSELSDFAGERSWKLFDDLQISEESKNWMLLPCEEWKKHESFLKFEKYVKSLACVNDTSERKIKLIQDYVSSAKNEEKRQNILQCAHRNRSLLSYDQMTKEIVNVFHFLFLV